VISKPSEANQAEENTRQSVLDKKLNKLKALPGPSEATTIASASQDSMMTAKAEQVRSQEM